MPELSSHTVAAHFTNRAPEVRRIYDRIIGAARKLGPARGRSHRELATWLKRAYELAD